MTFNITTLLEEARAIGRTEHREGEVKKLGNLRAGSTGIMSSEGEIAGACARTSYLRSQGIELDPPTNDKLIMFELGYANEDVIYKALKSSVPEGHIILREEEIPIEWFTSNGTKVTGRPDIVICQVIDNVIIPKDTSPMSVSNAPGEILYIPSIAAHERETIPVLGLELKSVHSMWTMREVLFNGEPKLNNLIQAAHYMWKLNVPYKLIYKSYSQLGQGMAGQGDKGWMTKQFPKQGEPMSEYVEYNDKGQIKHLKQFEIVYDLQFSSKGIMQYKPEAARNWTSTPVNKEDIERYFEFVSTMRERDVLGPLPLTIHANGEKANYSMCSYCPLQPVCKGNTDTRLSTWLEKIDPIIRQNM